MPRRTVRTGRAAETTEVAPERCPNGHGLGPDRMWVAHLPCGCEMTGHRIYTCRECGELIYDPSRRAGCDRMPGSLAEDRT